MRAHTAFEIGADYGKTYKADLHKRIYFHFLGHRQRDCHTLVIRGMLSAKSFSSSSQQRCFIIIIMPTLDKKTQIVFVVRPFVRSVAYCHTSPRFSQITSDDIMPTCNIADEPRRRNLLNPS